MAATGQSAVGRAGVHIAVLVFVAIYIVVVLLFRASGLAPNRRYH